jgi:hypothetical protein
MPATFAHPAAVLPFRGFDRWFNFAALVIGSVMPDFAYFIRRFDVATYAHTLSGTVFFCVPVGLFVFAIFHALRAPLCYVLPEPHRSALTPLATARFRLTTQSLIVLALSSARRLDACGGGLVHAPNRLDCPTSAVDAEDALLYRRGRLSGAPAFAACR